ncbi:MAG: ABC transporter permease subunit [Thermoplasmatales archaeon]
MNRNAIFPIVTFVSYSLLVLVIPLSFLVNSALHVSISQLLLSALADATKQSFLQATVSTLIALAFGIPVGMLLTVYNGRGKRVIVSLLLVTYVMPGIVMALGIISLFGYSSRFWEIIYGNVAYNSPLIAVLSYSTGSVTNIQEVYSAQVLGASDKEIFRRFYLRNLSRGGLLGAIMTFILSFEGFSLPLIVGGPKYTTIEVLIYEFKSIFPSFVSSPFSNASFAGLVQILILLIPLYLYVIVRTETLRGSSSLQNPFLRYKLISLLLLIVYIFFIYGPLFSMFLKYPPWDINFSQIATRLQVPIYSLISNTLLFSFASTFISFIVSTFLVIYGYGRLANLFLLLPLIFSPVTLALSFFLFYGSYFPTSILVIGIFAVSVIPITFRMLGQSIATIPASERSSSMVLGDGPISSFFRVQLPRIKVEVSTILSIAFITVMGQFASIATVYTPSTETLTIGIYNLLALRDLTGTYGLTEIFLIVIFISSYVINAFGRSGIGGKA